LRQHLAEAQLRQRPERVVHVGEDLARGVAGPAGRQHRRRQAGVQRRERPPRVPQLGPRHECLGRAHLAAAHPRPDRLEPRRELLVAGAQGVEVPRRERVARVAGCRVRRQGLQHGRVVDAELAQRGRRRRHRRSRRHPHAVVERREAQPPQPGAQRVPDVAPVLGHGEHDDDPGAVPRLRRLEAERGEPRVPGLQGAVGPPGQPVEGVAPGLRRREQAAPGEPAERRPGAGRRHPELAGQRHQRGRRQVLGAAQPVVREQRDEQVLRLGAGLRPGQVDRRVGVAREGVGVAERVGAGIEARVEGVGVVRDVAVEVVVEVGPQPGHGQCHARDFPQSVRVPGSRPA
jgi:hypothetical protein